MDKEKKKSTTAADLMEHPNTTAEPLSYARLIQNFVLLWLDGRLDDDNHDDCCKSINQLQQVVNNVNTFTHMDACVDFIDKIKQEKVFLISSGSLGETAIPIVHDKPQVSAIYIFCGDKIRHEKWARKWSKVEGIYTDIGPICEALKEAVLDCDQNMVSISYVKNTDGDSNQNMDELDHRFMYTQILKEILITIDFKQEHINEFLTYCRETLTGNIIELKNVDKIEREYRRHQPIWWYTYNCFLYSMLNRVLRTMEVDIIVKMGFFVRDLHQDISALHSKQCDEHYYSEPFTVYRGQGLSQTDFDQLMNTQGGLLSFNQFLSTSDKRDVSLKFTRRTMATSNLVGVLFVMKIDPSIRSTPFADVINVGCYKGEREILFSMHSVFRIGQVKKIDGNNRLWEVYLTLTSDNDRQLQTLTEWMLEETGGSTGWLRLGKLMLKLARYKDAENLYEILLAQTIDERQKGDIFYQIGQVKLQQGEYTSAIRFYENSLKIRQEILTYEHPDVAECYNDIGIAKKRMGEYSKAMSFYEKALKIRQKTLPPNHPNLAISYNSIAGVYNNMGNYSKSLLSYEKALDIRRTTLPSNHPELAVSYSNIGLVYNKMGEYSKALSYHERALEIRQKILPSNHPDLATSYNNIGWVYRNMGDYSKALSFYERALDILQSSASTNDSIIQSLQKSIDYVKKLHK